MNGENGKSEFEGFSLDAEKKILWRADEIVPLPPKAVEMLIVLVKNRGEVVSKSELLETVWGETFVEESVLSNNVYLLRKTLNEIAGVKNLIQTVPRRGYRFGSKEIEKDSEFVLEHHVFEQTVIEEISDGERIEEGGTAITENKNQLAADSTTKTIRRIPALPAGGQKNRMARVYSFAAVLLILTLTGGFAVWHWNRTTAQANLTQIKSIAVLPLKPIAASDADKVLSLGLADALITQLGASRNLVVRPVSSVFKYTDQDFDALAVGRDLQTDAILEGTFQRSENHLRVNVRLLRVSDGKQLWAGTFDETEADVFDLQDAISNQAATALAINLNQAERDLILKRYTDNVAAYQAYQRGRYLYFQREETKGNLENCFAEFEEAIRLDGDYALAYAGLADARSRLALDSGDVETRRQNYELAKELATKAIRLDPNLAEAYASLGWINRIYDWNWRESEANFKKAIELAPDLWVGYRLYAYLLITLGRTAEAVEVNRQAKKLNPLQGDGWILYYDRQYEAAAAELDKQLQISKSADIPHDLALTYIQLGRYAEAVEILEEASPKAQDSFKIQSALVIAQYRAGNLEKAENLLRDLEVKANNSSERFARIANVYAQMNRTEQAIAALQKALEARDDRLMWIKTNPNLDNLRDDPRFQEILRKMNL